MHCIALQYVQYSTVQFILNICTPLLTGLSLSPCEFWYQVTEKRTPTPDAMPTVDHTAMFYEYAQHSTYSITWKHSFLLGITCRGVFRKGEMKDCQVCLNSLLLQLTAMQTSHVTNNMVQDVSGN